VDAIEPILRNPTTPPAVGAAERSGRVHKDGRNGGGAQHESRRGRSDEEAVEVDVEGVDARGEDHGAVEPAWSVPARLPVHRIDFTAGDETDSPTHRIDLSA
jgi:hypothetical protein